MESHFSHSVATIETLLLLCVFLIVRSVWRHYHRRPTPAPLVEVLPASPRPISPELDTALKRYFAQVNRLPIAQREAEKERSANG